MKSKDKVFNTIMVILIGLVIVSGVMIVGNVRGWFGGQAYANNASASSTVGIVNIERDGIAYSIDESILRDEDILITGKGSSALIDAGKNTFMLSENSEVKITSAKGSAFMFEIISGEVFANVAKGSDLEAIEFDEYTLTVNGTVFSVSMQTGSANVGVFEGRVTVEGSLDSVSADAGEVVNCVGSAAVVNTMQVSSLNAFMIDQAKVIGESQEICFTNEQLQEVLDTRAEEMRLAQEEKAAHDAEVIAQGGTEATVSSKTSSSSSSSTGSSGSTTLPEEEVLTCTIQIRCDTILDNMENLTEGKDKYVPSNGVILSTSTVQFVEGETVFDVLKRTCNYAGIQLEYSYTPMYESHYIEGINHLYEFDCGNESGWMYKVNGWFPNYGCSKYELEDGDTIVWAYTCNGLGADVGGGVY